MIQFEELKLELERTKPEIIYSGLNHWKTTEKPVANM